MRNFGVNKGSTVKDFDDMNPVEQRQYIAEIDRQIATRAHLQMMRHLGFWMGIPLLIYLLLHV